MSYYRINTNLTIGSKIVNRNTIANLKLSEGSINKLLESGAISIISTPPLKFMPMWGLRAEKLEKLDIITGLDLLNSNLDFEHKEQWIQDMIDDLVVPDDERCCQ